MKILLKCKGTVTVKQEAYQVIYTIKSIINQLAQIYQVKQLRTTIPQQFNFARKLEEDNSATMISIAEKQQEMLLF